MDMARVNQMSPQAGTHACPGLRSGGPDSQGRPCPNTSVIPAPSPRHSPAGGNPRLPRTPIRGLGLSRQTMPQHIRHSHTPPPVIPAQAGTHACPGLRSGGPDSQGRPCPNTSVIPAPTSRHSRAGGNPRLPRTPIRGPGLSRQTMPQHIRHSHTPPPVIPAQAGIHACPGLRSGGPDSQGRPCPNTSVILAPTNRHSRTPPSFPRRREPTPAPDSDSGARTPSQPTIPKAPHPPSVIPTPHPPSFPRRREPTPAPDSDPGARTLRQVTSAIGTPPPTVTPAQAGTTPAPDSDPGARTTRQFATAPLSSQAPPHGQRP